MVVDANQVIADLLDAALFAKEAKDDKLVAQLKESFKEILLKQNQVKRRGEGIASAIEEGKTPQEIIQWVEQAQEQNEGSQWINIERHSDKWSEFVRKIEGKEVSGVQPEDEEEDIICVEPTQAQKAGLKNQRCPITAVDVTELVDPVSDTKGYIYERKALLQYLQRSGRPCPRVCPIAGSQHIVAPDELQSAELQIRKLKRLKKTFGETQTQAGGTQNDRVLDL